MDQRTSGRHRLPAAVALVAIASLVAAVSASAHAHISPPVALANAGQLYSLAVPTEKETAKTTKVVLTVPDGFSIDSFVPSPGWKRDVQQTGSGENTVVSEGDLDRRSRQAAFRPRRTRSSSSSARRARPRRTRSPSSRPTPTGRWSTGQGPESSDTPAPTVEAKSSLGGGGSSSTLTIVALVVGAVGVVLGGLALVAGGGKRPLA